jgi:hypothetical protein
MLHRMMPGCSARRIGDLLNAATMHKTHAQAFVKMPMAFGLVLDGYIKAGLDGGAMRIVGPGEMFGVAHYAAEKNDASMVVAALEGPSGASFLAFPHAALTALNLTELVGPSGGP